MPTSKAYILDRFADSNPNYAAWLNQCPVPFEIVTEFCPTWTPPRDAGILITHLHYRWEEVSTLRRVVEQTEVPALILADGVLEYRNTWENPTISDASIFQPLIGHKLACIGRAQARVIESWGNVGSCEIVGLPRLDEMLTGEGLPIQNTGSFRLLIATANTPAFTPSQRTLVIESLQDLKKHLDDNPLTNDGRRIEVQWRLTDRLDAEIGLSPSDISSPKQSTLQQAIDQSDAVITTPSTLYFESVLKHRPTAILDYNNSPQYLPAAWMITADRQLNSTLNELAKPPAAKLQFQRQTLHDQLECETPATPRLIKLIQTMVESHRQAIQQNQRLKLPPRILTDPRNGFSAPDTEFNLADLYPENPAFQQTDIARIQVELSQAIARLKQLPAELDAKNADLIRKGKHIDDLNAQYQQALAQKAEDIKKKSDHILAMQKFLAEAQARVQELTSQLNQS